MAADQGAPSMTMSKNPTFLVTYTGEGVVSLARVGLFQTGTTAVVGAEAAEAARAQGHFQVRRFDESGEPQVLPPPTSPVTPPVMEVIYASPPAPPAVSEPPAGIVEPPAVLAEPLASEHMDSPPAPHAEDMQPAAALGDEAPTPEEADDAHETDDDGDGTAHHEESGGEGAPPRRRSRRR